MAERCTIIYVMSDVRSGSTLLENILSKSAEATSVGELALLKGHILKQGPGIKWNWTCSCGKPVLECNFWQAALAGVDTTSPDFVTAIQWNYKSKRLLAGSFFSPLLQKSFLAVTQKKLNKNAASILNKIYTNIFNYTGKKFIIDSSKDPVQAYMIYLNKPKNFDVKIVYLRRDLRAIAASKVKWSIANQKKKQKTLSKFLTNSLFYKKLCNYVLRNVPAADIVTINYEQLAQQTQQQLDKVTTVTGMQPYTAPEFMVVEDDHTIAGTPQRFTKKPIAYDNSWRKAFSKKPILFFLGNIMNKI